MASKSTTRLEIVQKVNEAVSTCVKGSGPSGVDSAVEALMMVAATAYISRRKLPYSGSAVQRMCEAMMGAMDRIYAETAN